ncbi:hypothetical protein QBC39DRAFT_22024 [Podospora conica]|nr:hypothetical protein QBC39DRAFT_22024 [Schizothecium conicum]
MAIETADSDTSLAAVGLAAAGLAWLVWTCAGPLHSTSFCFHIDQHREATHSPPATIAPRPDRDPAPPLPPPPRTLERRTLELSTCFLGALLNALPRQIRPTKPRESRPSPSTPPCCSHLPPFRAPHASSSRVSDICLGEFGGIFSQHARQTDLLARFQKSFLNILDRHLPSRHQVHGKTNAVPKTKVSLDSRILELIIGLGDSMPPAPLLGAPRSLGEDQRLPQDQGDARNPHRRAVHRPRRRPASPLAAPRPPPRPR